ncbi:thiamine pyrophosphate-dependent enzyme [Corynebacterium epidermidicanis]|uniref:Transketolase, beta subunit n=1 Tax=Corynebacterium epidermidicanis TaxID=1050174 RepID=A0A0G3GWB0_9CORY|nr:thiamine pyrophosphate-dependent enzyme [Corynebacterium epidermidicanis]AKK03107.1 transketolase, beta subunit [Corynebacterium epidermidicanis]
MSNFSREDVLRLMQLTDYDEKHSPSAHSTLNTIVTLYREILDHDTDKFLLSKGHGPLAYYATLAAAGFFPTSWIATYGQFDSPLGPHPDRMLIPGVELSSGSLGQGLPIACGVAISHKAQAKPGRIFVLVGDGEMDEGSNHEALALATARNLNNLTLLVIDNRSRSYPQAVSLSGIVRAHGWQCVSVADEPREIRAALATSNTTPKAIIVETNNE